MDEPHNASEEMATSPAGGIGGRSREAPVAGNGGRPRGAEEEGGDESRPLPRVAGWWLALGVICFLIFGMQMSSMGGDPDAALDPTTHSSVQLKVVARYLVGIKGMGEMFPGATKGLESQLEGVAEQVKEAGAANEIDHLRGVAVLAELVGAKQGLEWLSELEAELGGSDDEAHAELMKDAELFRRALGAGAALERAAAEAEEETQSTEEPESSESIAEPDAAVVAELEPLTDEDRQRLIDRHGWFGELALAHGKDSSDPVRARLQSEGMRVVVALVTFAILVVAGFLIGCCLFVLGAVLVGTGKIRPRYPAVRRVFAWPHSAFLQTGVLFLGLFILVQVVIGLIGAIVEHYGGDFEPMAKVLVPLSMWGVALITLWPLTRGHSMAQLRAAYGWHANGRGIGGVFREIGFGIVGYLAGMPLLVAGLLMTVALMGLTGSESSHPVQNQLEIHSAFDALMLYLLAVVWAPLVEESIFRGALFHQLRQWTSVLPTAMVTAFVFAIIHPQGFAGVPVLMSLAITFALLREWRGSLIASITGHALNNGVVITLGIVMLT